MSCSISGSTLRIGFGLTVISKLVGVARHWVAIFFNLTWIVVDCTVGLDGS